MVASPIQPGGFTPRLPLLHLLALAALATSVWYLDHRLTEQSKTLGELRDTLQAIRGEVTRARLEQTASAKGPAGLLEKLRHYAAFATDARVPEPDYRYARKEIDAILLAFESLGADAAKPLQDRLADAKPATDYEELTWLLEAYARVDKVAGVTLLKQVLLGVKLPDPKLRWRAADLLTRIDLPLARNTLRQVLLTESARGPNLERAQAIGALIPDRAALAATGFDNFVSRYVRTEDPQCDDTLLMVLGRTEHDRTTIQECIKALGAHRCERAVEPIRKLYENPPLQQEDPIFLNYCLEAVTEIQGPAAKDWLEAQLPKATSDTVAKRIEFLLNKLRDGGSKPAAASTAPADKK